MKTILLLSGLVLALTNPALPDALATSSRGEMPEARMGPSMVERTYLGTVVEVRSWDRVMVVADHSHGMQSMRVDQHTAIRQGDKGATWNDIQPGVMVDGLCVGPADNAYAETVNIGR